MTHEDVITSIALASDRRPLKVLSVWVDSNGWWSGWAEPVTHLALVERSWYSEPLNQLPADPSDRREFLRERETVLEPVIYDVNSLSGFSTLGALSDAASRNEQHDVLPADCEWEDVVRVLETAQRCTRRIAKTVAQRA